MKVRPGDLRHCEGTLPRRALLRAGLAGGLRMGQAISSTSIKGDEPASRPLSPNDVLATWYRFLGIPLDTQFHDHFGRPTPILPHGAPIAELI